MSEAEFVYTITDVQPVPTHKVSAAEFNRQHSADDVHKPDREHPNQSHASGNLILFSAPCVCGDDSHSFYTSVYAEFPPDDCWIKE